MAPKPLQKGDPSRIGRYRVTARLGAGGMGVVYLGSARGGNQVAIKVLRPELADDQTFRIRFRREASTLEKVGGLCTVRVLEADADSPRPYLVTEYAEGPSLSEWISSRGPLQPDMLYGLATGLAEALTAIHAAGIVHRDLKPGNVLLTATGPKVIDFGIAQALGGTALTQTGMTVGSPGFMAPEQILGHAAQPADVFAWGLTVAFAATGRSPFGVGPAEALHYRILNTPPDLARVPAAVGPLIEAALAKEAALRPSAPDLLRQLTSGTGRRASPGGSLTKTVLDRTWQPPRPAGRHGKPRKGTRGLPVTPVAAVALIAAVLVGAYFTVLPRTQATPGAAPPSTARPAGTVESSGAAASSPAPTARAIGGIAAGTRDCAYGIADGTYRAMAEITHSTCVNVDTVLAKWVTVSGDFWTQATYEPQAQARAEEETGDGTIQVCSLTGDGMTLNIWDFRTNALRTTLGTVATKLCAKAEAAGWNEVSFG